MCSKSENVGIEFVISECGFKQTYIEITNKCNLYCEYCFNCSDFGKNKFFTKDDIFEVVKNCSVGERRLLVYLSGGEPLLHPEIEQIVDGLIDDMQCDVKILSNGALVEEIAYKLNKGVKWQIGSAMISTRQMFEANWEEYIHNINTLVYMFPNSEVTLAYTITKDNYSYIERYIERFVDYDNVNILLSFVQSRGRGIERWNDISVPLTVKLKIIQQFSNKWSNVRFCGLELDDDLMQLYNSRREITCDHVKELYVDYNGEMHFCKKVDTFCQCQNLRLLNEEKFFFKVSKNCTAICSDYHKCMASCISNIAKGERLCKIV